MGPVSAGTSRFPVVLDRGLKLLADLGHPLDVQRELRSQAVLACADASGQALSNGAVRLEQLELGYDIVGVHLTASGTTRTASEQEAGAPRPAGQLAKGRNT
jgi:hypothetical protein